MKMGIADVEIEIERLWAKHTAGSNISDTTLAVLMCARLLHLLVLLRYRKGDPMM